MSILAAAFVFPAACLIAFLGGRWMDRRETARQARRPTGARYVDSPGFPPLPVHRQPGQTKAALDEQHDVWSATYPPGSLGDYPEQLPEQPGRMTHEDSLDVVIAASKLTRAAAEQHKNA